MQSLEEDPSSDFLFCTSLIVRNGIPLELIVPEPSEDIQKSLVMNTSLFGTGSNIFFRRRVLDDVKGFDESYFRRQDNEFLLRGLENHGYRIIDSVDVMKINNGSANRPSYQKLVSANQMYYRDFQQIFARLSQDELQSFKENEAASVLFCCMCNEDAATKQRALQTLLSYRNLTLQEKVQFGLSKVTFKDSNLLNVVQPVLSRLKNKRRSKKLLQEMDPVLLSEVEALL